jgi:hypothetical protein
MTIAQRLRSFRAWLDFGLRQQIRFSWPVTELGPTAARYQCLQLELAAFLAPSAALLKAHFSHRPRIEVLDVGAKDFFAGPVLEQYFLHFGATVAVHGIELDAYRRMHNFRTRADYAQYFVSQMRAGAFHATDFLHWNQKADVIFAGNPFVTAEPLLRWGLPLGHLQPEKYFQQCHRLLAPRQGVFLASNPTVHEQNILKQLANKSRFSLLQEWKWEPNTLSLQKKPRYGSLWKISNS